MSDELPKGHKMSDHEDIVGQVMHRWKHHDPKPLHSGRGKGGKEGKIVKDQDQAIAIALSIADKAKKKGKGKAVRKSVDHIESRIALEYNEQIAERVSEILGELFDFTRCQKPNGKIYGSPNRCRPPAVEIGAKEPSAPMAAPKTRGAKKGSMQITRRIREMSAEDLGKVLKDPRLNDKQRETLEKLIAEKDQGKKPGTAASRVARPVDPKVAKRVDRAMAAKQKGPTYTPEQLAAQDRLKAEAKAKEQPKPKLSPEEEKARAKYYKLKEKADTLRATEVRIKEEVEKELGTSVSYSNTKAWSLYNDRLKEAGTSVNKVLAAEKKAKEAMTPSLKEEIHEAKIKENKEAWSKLSKEEKKRLVEDWTTRRLKDPDIKLLDSQIKTWTEMTRENPEINTTDNRIALMAMRAQRMKLFMATKSEREARKVAVEELVKSSPKYDSTPGSSQVMPKVKSEDIAAELRKIEREHTANYERLKKEGRDKESWLERDSALSASRAADLFERGYTGNPPMEIMYRLQGYNAKPEAVATRADLEKRADLINGEDGKPLILWRGVTTEGFADQFKGGGPDGDLHYPGKGIYGNGTYAASHSPGTTSRWSAFEEAASYAGGSSSEGLDRRLTAFAIRSDARVVQFEGGTWMDRSAKFGEWKKSIIEEAEKKTGFTFHDPGEAAAALGIHAYRVPQGSREDFWVILNRGALVVAGDSQIQDKSTL